MTRALTLIALPLLLAACGRGGQVNAPTDPAAPIDTPAAAAPPPAEVGRTPTLPGMGPTSFVGRWTADVSWCPNTAGAEQPIEITPLRFEGYENGCDIGRVDQVEDGYVAALTCRSEGATRHERVRMVVAGQTMDLTYLDRGGAAVKLTKCTTLADIKPRTP